MRNFIELDADFDQEPESKDKPVNLVVKKQIVNTTDKEQELKKKDYFSVIMQSIEDDGYIF